MKDPITTLGCEATIEFLERLDASDPQAHHKMTEYENLATDVTEDRIVGHLTKIETHEALASRLSAMLDPDDPQCLCGLQLAMAFAAFGLQVAYEIHTQRKEDKQ